MNKLIALSAALFLAFCVGCGPKATDTTRSVPPPSTEDTQQEIQEAMDTGKIDPETYGKQQ